MAQADDILQANMAGIVRTGAWLRSVLPLNLAPTLYRGMILKRLPAGDTLGPDPRKVPYLSMTEDMGVACWFADPVGTMSPIHVGINLGSYGVVAFVQSTPAIHDRVLWHHTWQEIPLMGGGTVPLREIAYRILPAETARQVDAAARSQQEVILLAQRGERLPFLPLEESGCPPLDELEDRYGF
jgi:hypothetical protein